MIPKRAVKRFSVSMAIVLSTIITFFLAIPAYAVTAEDYVALGKDALIAQDIVKANNNFLAALQLDSGHAEANLFYAATRILNLVYAEASNTLLDRFGIDAAGREFYAWTADFPRNAEGDIVLPSDAPTSGDVLAYLETILLPQIDGALGNLDALEDAASETTAPITVVSAALLNDEVDMETEVDYGDVALYRSILQLAKSIILGLNSYDLDVDIDDLAAKANNDNLNIVSDVIEAYPSLLKLSDPMLSGAKAALVESIEAYQAASAFIRNEPDAQDDDLITIDLESTTDESHFRVALAQIRDSLLGPAQGPFALEFGQLIHLGHFFDNPMDLRDFLSGGGIQRFLKEQVLYQVDHALAQLSDVPNTFSGTLSPADYPLDMAAEIDFGDIAMAKSLLLFGKAVIQTFNAYDTDVALYDILDKIDKDAFRIDEDLIQAHPKLFTIHPDHQLAGAKSSLLAGIDAYNAASNFIRSETDDQVDDWIQIRTDDELSEDAEIRAFLSDLKNALAGPAMMDANRYRSGRDQFMLDLTQFFDSPIDNLRDYLPDFNTENKVIHGSFPDPAIGGVLPDFQQDDWREILDLSINPFLQKLIMVLQVCAGIDVPNVRDAVEDVNNDQMVGLQEAIHYLHESVMK